MQRLKIEHLTKTYPNGVRALQDVSLEIGNGMFGLLGPNGAGKSSLMKILATLLQPDSGAVFLDGTDIGKNPYFLRSKLGYLPQDFGVYPKISAVQLLDHLAVLKGIANKEDRKQQVQALLQQTNLFENRRQAVSTFSGGMRQRFGIAQALLGNPQLIIADEPTAGLDPKERNRFHDLLSEIGEKVIVLLSTHIVEDVHDLCPEMAVLTGGKLILKGKPSALTEKLAGRVWQKMVSKEALSILQAHSHVISTRFIHGSTQVHVLSETKPDSGFQPVEPSLEDVYFSTLTGSRQPGRGQFL
ncbi:ABC-type multidrug transport system, ATPase component [Dyadobacter koreensis]|uniref:ABC-type multidrug transport system, ATPase component n=1 Tax=Dyadobacter koreensis TaxID=408657 RepID=A0A1H6QFG8_9BACT|nr:ABC transporter ATP-binding protein [Dyadobacter koreensis]SEI38220.1 ABC-type multidrug transport system, ATPase component [Dyadobacter koreensis]